MDNLNKDTVIFGNTSFADISENIYKTSKKRSVLIDSIVKQITDLIKTPTDASFVIPLLKELLDSDIKNSDIQIKLAGIMQKLISVTSKLQAESGDTFDFSDLDDITLELGQELNQLQEESKPIEKDPMLQLSKAKVERELKKLENE